MKHRCAQQEVPCITPETHNPSYGVPGTLKSLSFAEKLHHLLGQEEFQDSIAWVPHGRAFRILDPKRLEGLQVLQPYFGYGDYSTFLTELQQNGFKRTERGEGKNAFYHEVSLDACLR